MTSLRPPHHRLVKLALVDARRWCRGHIIDDGPAFAHAVQVAVVLGEHVATPAPELIAAVLLHDAPEFAPAELDLDAVLQQRYGGEVRRIIRALEAEHLALDTATPTLPVGDLPVLLASTADKIVALASLIRRARRSGNPFVFFAVRPVLLARLPHFWAFRHAGAGVVPATMTTALDHVLGALPEARRTA